jgi:thiosulfate/3-mercaptopyruvate sulfurtransferase
MAKEKDIRKSDNIVCYDNTGMLTAPRGRWMFKVFGAKNVFILNGGFNLYKSEGLKVQEGESEDMLKRIRKSKAKLDDY